MICLLCSLSFVAVTTNVARKAGCALLVRSREFFDIPFPLDQYALLSVAFFIEGDLHKKLIECGLND